MRERIESKHVTKEIKNLFGRSDECIQLCA